MKTVFIFRILIDDGIRKLELTSNRVEWLEGGDSKVAVYALIGVNEGKLLDEWESSKKQLYVTIEPLKCGQFGQYGDEIYEPCDPQTLEYNSQQGKATLTWEYVPQVQSKIIFNFIETQG